MQGGMKAYSNEKREDDQHSVAREIPGNEQFATPHWLLEGHTLASEHENNDLLNGQKTPAVTWRWEKLYEGDATGPCIQHLWDEITDPDRVEPYVLLLHRYGEVFRRIDIC